MRKLLFLLLLTFTTVQAVTISAARELTEETLINLVSRP